LLRGGERQTLGEERYATLYVVAAAGAVWTLREYCWREENSGE
jgi:hypothetical protein